MAVFVEAVARVGFARLGWVLLVLCVAQPASKAYAEDFSPAEREFQDKKRQQSQEMQDLEVLRQLQEQKKADKPALVPLVTILNAQTPEEMNNILNGMFRPTVMVPGVANLEGAEVTKVGEKPPAAQKQVDPQEGMPDASSESSQKNSAVSGLHFNPPQKLEDGRIGYPLSPVKVVPGEDIGHLGATSQPAARESGTVRIRKEDISAPMPLPPEDASQVKTVYRLDFRPVGEVMDKGFEGTNKTWINSDVYGENTVFAARDLPGVLNFGIESMLNKTFAGSEGFSDEMSAHYQSKPGNLYKINIEGLQRLDVAEDLGFHLLPRDIQPSEQYLRSDSELVQAYARKMQHKDLELSEDEVRNAAKEKAVSYYKGAAAFTHEMMIKGPIAPDRIEHIATIEGKPSGEASPLPASVSTPEPATPANQPSALIDSGITPSPGAEPDDIPPPLPPKRGRPQPQF